MDNGRLFLLSFQRNSERTIPERSMAGGQMEKLNLKLFWRGAEVDDDDDDMLMRVLDFFLRWKLICEKGLLISFFRHTLIF